MRGDHPPGPAFAPGSNGHSTRAVVPGSEEQNIGQSGRAGVRLVEGLVMQVPAAEHVDKASVRQLVSGRWQTTHEGRNTLG